MATAVYRACGLWALGYMKLVERPILFTDSHELSTAVADLSAALDRANAALIRAGVAPVQHVVPNIDQISARCLRAGVGQRRAAAAAVAGVSKSRGKGRATLTAAKACQGLSDLPDSVIDEEEEEDHAASDGLGETAAWADPDMGSFLPLGASPVPATGESSKFCSAAHPTNALGDAPPLLSRDSLPDPLGETSSSGYGEGGEPAKPQGGAPLVDALPTHLDRATLRRLVSAAAAIMRPVTSGNEEAAEAEQGVTRGDDSRRLASSRRRRPKRPRITFENPPVEPSSVGSIGLTTTGAATRSAPPLMPTSDSSTRAALASASAPTMPVQTATPLELQLPPDLFDDLLMSDDMRQRMSLSDSGSAAAAPLPVELSRPAALQPGALQRSSSLDRFHGGLQRADSLLPPFSQAPSAFSVDGGAAMEDSPETAAARMSPKSLLYPLQCKFPGYGGADVLAPVELAPLSPLRLGRDASAAGPFDLPHHVPAFRDRLTTHAAVLTRESSAHAGMREATRSAALSVALVGAFQRAVMALSGHQLALLLQTLLATAVPAAVSSMSGSDKAPQQGAVATTSGSAHAVLAPSARAIHDTVISPSLAATDAFRAACEAAAGVNVVGQPLLQHLLRQHKLRPWNERRWQDEDDDLGSSGGSDCSDCGNGCDRGDLHAVTRFVSSYGATVALACLLPLQFAQQLLVQQALAVVAAAAAATTVTVASVILQQQQQQQQDAIGAGAAHSTPLVAQRGVVAH